MKVHQRLDYDRLAEVLGDRGLVEITALQHVLHQCIASGQLFPEVLVSENLISDWELARVACETFNLPFLPVDIYSPSLNATTDLDVSFLHQHALVPLDRFGTQLTVAMPIIVPSRILTGLEREHNVEVVPVVGCVGSNRLWLQNNLTLQARVGATEGGEGAAGAPAGDPWAGIFDAGDAAVLLDLEESEPQEFSTDEFSMEGLEALDDVLSGSVLDSENTLDAGSSLGSDLDADLQGILDSVDASEDIASIDPPSILAPPSVEPEPKSTPAAVDDSGDSASIDLPEIS